LKDKIENHKNFDKRVKEKKPRNQKKKDQIEFFFLLLKKQKHKIDLKDKIESIKTLTKENKKQNKKSIVDGLNRKILYIEIRIEGLN
jgi:hypothetical protein